MQALCEELNLRGDGDMNREAELELLSHPEKWPHDGLLPLSRRGGSIVYNEKDAGIIMEDDLCCVWTGNYLGECDPRKGTPVRYGTLEEVLTEWAID
jgi:hypothetical protein